MSTYHLRFVSLFIGVVFLLCLTNSHTIAGWQTQTVDSAGNLGQYTSLAFDSSGNPAISYYDVTNADLKYAHDANGDGDFADAGEIITIDSTGNVGQYTFLAFDPSGNPAISYYDRTNSDLKFAHDKNGDGDFADAGEIITVDSTGNVGQYTSLAFGSFGEAAISYYDATGGNLKLAEGDNLDDPEPFWLLDTFDSAGTVGMYTSLAFDNSGNPTISYYDATGGNLKFLSPGEDPAREVFVDVVGNVGKHTSLAFESHGYPIISYYDVTNGDLKFAYDKNGDGDFSDRGERTTVASIGNVGQYTSIALDASGKLAMSYYDVTNRDLKIARFAAIFWAITTVDSVGSVGKYTSLAFDSFDEPAISYYDATNRDLKLARFVP